MMNQQLNVSRIVNYLLTASKIFGVILLASPWIACNKSQFHHSKAAKTPIPQTSDQSDGQPIETSNAQPIAEHQEAEIVRSTVIEKITAQNISEFEVTPTFKGGYDVKSLAPNARNHMWIATSNGLVRYYVLEKGHVISQKSWSGATPNGGTRTYVLQGGAVVLAKNGGHLYFLHEGVPEGAIDRDPAKGYYHLVPGVASDQRSCVVSYRKNNQAYLGVAYGLGQFVEIELEQEAPHAPKFALAKPAVTAGPILWGYSCYIDQVRLQFYSQWYQGTTQALDLKTMQPLDVSKAPNAAFASVNVPALSVGANAKGNGSYAMSGDRIGNVLNASGFYTLAFEPKNAMVWGTHGTNLSIYPHDCVYKTQDCKGFASYNLMEKIGAGIGPLSALNDGYMVGVVRGAGDVYLFNLKEQGDATKEIDAKLIIDNVGGDPYMYTDFTGATLYLDESLNEYEFTKAPTWNPNQLIRQLAFSWDHVEGSPENWENIKAEVRCFADEQSKPDFEIVEIWAKPKKSQLMQIKSCINQKVGKAELKLTQLNQSNSLMGVAKVQLTAFQ